MVSDDNNKPHGPFIVLNSNNILLDDYYIVENEKKGEETVSTEKLIIHNEFLGDLLAWSKYTILNLENEVEKLNKKIESLEAEIEALKSKI
jgi:hypothetical protein